jgi:hypothetical protein
MNIDTLTSDISFCNRRVKNIISDDMKQFILDKLINDYNISIPHKDCVVLKQNYLNNLKINEHVIGLKTYGNPYYLFLTKLNGINCCFYIDKKIKEGFSLPRIIICKSRFSDDIFNDTLIEGELIRTKNENWVFLFSNLYAYKGNIIESNMINKINTFYNILKNEYKPDSNLDVCKFKVKKIFTYNQFSDLIENFIPNLPYSIKGLIFYPTNKKYNNLLYLFPKQNNNIKNKKVDNKKIQNNNIQLDKFDKKINTGLNFIKTQNTINENDFMELNDKINIENVSNIIGEFKILPTSQPDIFNLYILHNKNNILYGLAHIQTLKCSKFVKGIFKNKEEVDINIVKCKYSLKFKKWEPFSLSENKEPDNFINLKSKILSNS